MKIDAIAALAGAAFLALGASASADEVTTTKTVKTVDPTVVVAPTPVPAPGVIVDGDGGCTTKKVVKTDGVTGETVKKTKTDC